MTTHDVSTQTRSETTPAIPRVLSIAGTDPTGGAGIQADLKSIAANGGYAMAVTTALVAQNTMGVRSIHVPPVTFLTEQLTAVSDDVTIDAVKIGMLFDAEIIGAVSTWLQATRPPVVVLDPVMVATSGDRLLSEDAENALRDLLVHADVVTPNLPELAALVGEAPAGTWDEAIRQARRLSRDHGVLVLAKGGHLGGPDAPDALVNAAADTVTEFHAPRVETRNTHGTGCSLSSALATLRPQSATWEEAVERAKGWLHESIQAADELHVGRGNGPISHFAGLWSRGRATVKDAAQVERQWWDAIRDVRASIDELSFIRGLADGTLDTESFAWYLAQDALYLRDYSRVLAQASSLAPTTAEQAFWANSAHVAIATELDLHATWLPADHLFDAEPSPTTTAYLNHLLACAARGDYSELVAALLPCYWIYYDVGTRLIGHAGPTNPYSAWLETYGDPEFAESNRQAIEIVTSRAAAAGPAEGQRMWRAFEASARHELDFFAAPHER